MTVPFLELKPAYLELKRDLDDAYARVMNSGWYVLGEELTSFEEEFAQYCDVPHCVAVSSGLDAIELALKAGGLGPSDEVIVPAHTFIATWLAASKWGGVCVPVEPDPTTFNLSPDAIRTKLTSKTRAIIPVHLYGQTADMDPIMEIASEHDLFVVEDAAQAHGARYKGRRAGGLGHAGCFSFYPGKNLGAFGDGGAITTHDSGFAERLRTLRNYGAHVKYHHDVKGTNSRLDELQAAFLRVKLQHLDAWNLRRREMAVHYMEQLSGYDDLTLPTVPEWADPVWHLFVVRHPHRDALQQALANEGVGSLIHYPIPPHLSPAYAEMGFQRGSFPLAEEIADTVLSLPMGPHLSMEEAGTVTSVLHRVLSSSSPL